MKAPEDILRLINFCKTIQRADTDPFDLDVKRFLTILSEYVRRWKSIDDLMSVSYTHLTLPTILLV